MTAAAIFVKTPGHSPLKTRLAASLGTEATERLYRQCAAAVAAAASEASLSAVYWATAEPSAGVAAQWPGLEHIDQGEGGLGDRMHRILEVLVERHGSGLLLGADAPQLDPHVLSRVAVWLEHSESRRVIGPASDGGFWTFGANRVPPLSRWIRVPYSRPDTLKAFRKSLGDDGEWLDLPMLTDLDSADDMARLAAELASLPNPLPRQIELMDRLGESKPA